MVAQSLVCLCHFVDVFLCIQVLDWIENHGEAFLSKHTGVGKSLHRARALQKRHEDFEEVAQVPCFCFLKFSLPVPVRPIYQFVDIDPLLDTGHPVSVAYR